VYFLVCLAFTCLRNPLRSKQHIFRIPRGDERAIPYPLIKALVELAALSIAETFNTFVDKNRLQIIS